eukprot:359140-Chlamydomonas_euryale.AAC.4
MHKNCMFEQGWRCLEPCLSCSGRWGLSEHDASRCHAVVAMAYAETRRGCSRLTVKKPATYDETKSRSGGSAARCKALGHPVAWLDPLLHRCAWPILAV